MAADDGGIAREIRALLAARDADASICPSEVARALWPASGWREGMDTVRRVARALARDAVIVITRGDVALDPDAPFDGPVRLRRGARWTSWN